MSERLSELLAHFCEDNAEQTYGKYYKYCASDELDAAGAEEALHQMVAWINSSESSVFKSYGLLMLGGLVDSGKLHGKIAAPMISELFVQQSQSVTSFDVLNHERKFVHFVSHFGYLAGSFCEQFGSNKTEVGTIVLALMDLYLRAPLTYWCGEALLLARVILDAGLAEEKFDAMLARILPIVVLQDADNWDAEAADRWRLQLVLENHKRQLAMALHAVDQNNGKALPSSSIAELVAAHCKAMFG